ncbi:hypothetical protein [Tsukamurella tyrosinosolvens]|uniref:hypothetical protein n=1 Tax=Tsukamurella tyrosinosolvens TaxID=57704 RepID=UPI0011C03796|nr:hypothetical protein [Tsukamurella tyrosinosolvens]
MIDFLWGLAGCLVAAGVVGILVNLLLETLTEPATLAPSTTDKVLGFVIGVVTMVALSSAMRALVADPSPFVDQLSLGAGISVVFGAPQFLALGRGHRRDRPSPPPRVSRRPRPRVPAATFAQAVHGHFAAPESRARYVIAAYRRGLIPGEYVPDLAADLAPLLPDGAAAWAELAAHDGGTGLGVTVDWAAQEIGYAPSSEEEWTDAVERLVYAAMCSTDPMVRRATVELLAPTGASPAPEWHESYVRSRVDVLRASIETVFAVRYDRLLTPGVEIRFRDPTVRAHDLIAGTVAGSSSRRTCHRRPPRWWRTCRVPGLRGRSSRWPPAPNRARNCSRSSTARRRRSDTTATTRRPRRISSNPLLTARSSPVR